MFAKLTTPLGVISILFAGAIFGFYYAWVCSTMWGLDTADPRIAISAMQSMNASVRNMVFAPAFFGTPFVLLATATVALGAGFRSASLFFALGGVLGLCMSTLFTMLVNVPMNEALAKIDIPQDRAAAQAIWDAYSPEWQIWNTLRTVASAGVLILAALGLRALR